MKRIRMQARVGALAAGIVAAGTVVTGHAVWLTPVIVALLAAGACFDAVLTVRSSRRG
ncbi:MAG: hypothetical protein Q4B10_01340 [Actinomycetaceae bacterium]|nr:hypothetical protein [Actinomycetaceae bacterium]